MSDYKEGQNTTKEILISEISKFLENLQKQENPDFRKEAVKIINAVGKVTTITQGIINELAIEMMTMTKPERDEVDMVMSQVMPKLNSLRLKCLFVYLLKSQKEKKVGENPEDIISLFVSDIDFISGVLPDIN